MTVNDLAGESRGTETRVLVSLQWPSDSTMTRQVALQVPFELHPRGKPLSCAWGVRGKGAASGAASRAPRWLVRKSLGGTGTFWWFLAVLQLTEADKLLCFNSFCCLPSPPSSPTSHRVARSCWGDQGIKT